jgi:drug/metabolite transporter (DMT)-like permease
LWSFEVILIKQLSKFKVNGDSVGIYYAFFVGVLASIGLVVYSIFGGMKNEFFTIKDYSIMASGGVIETLGMIFTIYASSIGNPGIAFAISFTSCIYVTLFNYFAMNELITAVQIVGIVLTLLGAIVVALEAEIYKLLPGL